MTTAISIPIIYAQLIPLGLLDLFATVFQRLCFPLYKIPLVSRKDHVVMDRKHLPYLNWVEKINCIYCEYANGIISYVGEIAARTEQYWCPIKHGRVVKRPHSRYAEFLPYGDAQAFHTQLSAQRARCRACETTSCPSNK